MKRKPMSLAALRVESFATMSTEILPGDDTGGSEPQETKPDLCITCELTCMAGC